MGDDGDGDRINEVMTAAHSPWQNAYAERLIGSIRRECLDPVIVANERGLRRVLQAYLAYYLKSRTHLSLGQGCAGLTTHCVLLAMAQSSQFRTSVICTT